MKAMDFLERALQRFVTFLDRGSDIRVIFEGPDRGRLDGLLKQLVAAAERPPIPDLPLAEQPGLRGMGSPGQTELAVVSAEGLAACPELAEKLGAPPQRVLMVTDYDLLLGGRNQTLQLLCDRASGAVQRLDVDALRAVDEFQRELTQPENGALRDSLGGALQEVLRLLQGLKDNAQEELRRTQEQDSRRADAIERKQGELDRKQLVREFLGQLGAAARSR